MSLDHRGLATLSDLRIESSAGGTRQPVSILSDSMPREGIDLKRFSRQVLLDPNFDADGSLLALTSRGGDAADSESCSRGYILALKRKVPLENAPLDSDLGYITLFGVDPQWRNQGIGSALLMAAEEYLRKHGCRSVLISPYAPGYFIPGVDVEAYANGLRFLLQRGYRELYRPLSMERSLWDYEWPVDLTGSMRELGPEIGFESGVIAGRRVLETLQFASEVFPGDWVRVLRECLGEIAAGSSEDRLHLALEFPKEGAPRVIGFSHFRAERFGPIGVHPNYRGRGLGKILTHMTLRSQQQSGYRSSWFLWTDDRTAERLYTPAGFREVRRFAVLKKDL